MDHSTAWQKAVLADIALIQAAGLRPLALIRRLEDALVGLNSPDRWYEFRAASRGKSNYRQQKTDGSVVHVIALEFRNRQAAAALHDKLQALAPQFKAIRSLYLREFDPNSASINLYVPATLTDV